MPKRRKGLARGSSELKRSRLRSISPKQREKKAEDARRVKIEGYAFHAAIAGERCVVCGRTNDEAWKLSGYGHEAHHAIRQEVLERLGLGELRWSPDLAVCVCAEPCHRRHTTRIRRIRRDELPDRVWRFVERHGLMLELDRECLI